MKRKLVSLVSIVVVVGVMLGAVTQRQLLRDHYVVYTATQQPESTELKANLGLTEKADFLYRASQPLIQSADEFNQSCKNVSHEHSIVLGCYTAQRIYIYDVKDERLSGVEEVTAAHELLHAVYERLSSSERRDLNKHLVSTANTVNNERFKTTVDEYRRAEPSQLENELHSILGTELEVLPDHLEQHYKKYFTNRAQIVAYAKQYEETFANLDEQIKTFDAQLAQLREQKETLEGSLQDQQQAIEARRASLDALRARGDIEEYNASVPLYNEQIRSYNTAVAELRRIVEEYNRVVERRNSLAATQNDLVHELDSSYDTLQ